MAAAHGALTGRPAAVLVTRAVGSSNLAIALHAAHADSAPLIAIVGQVTRSSRGREAFQEADLVATLGGLCRWAREVRDVAALPGALDEALRRATTGRPGPVLLGIPRTSSTSRSHRQRPHRDRHRAGTAARPGAGPDDGQAGPPPPPRRGAPRHPRRRRRPPLSGDGRPRAPGGDGGPARGDCLAAARCLPQRPRPLSRDERLLRRADRAAEAPRGGRHAGARLSPQPGGLVRVDRACPRHALGARRPGASRCPCPSAPDDRRRLDARTFVRRPAGPWWAACWPWTRSSAGADANAADRAAYEAARVVDGEPWDGPGLHPGRVVTALGGSCRPTPSSRPTRATSGAGPAPCGCATGDLPGLHRRRHGLRPPRRESRHRSPRRDGRLSPSSATAAWG